MSNWTLHVLALLPKHLISRAVGWWARRRRPRFLVRAVMGWYARRYELDFSITKKAFEDHDSLLSMFTRTLRPESRPIAQDPDAIVSPVDGKVGALGRIEHGKLYQAKGMNYRLSDLLGPDAAADRFEGGWFVTLYLSPHDYHRIHSPAVGRVTRSYYEPGTLWPVHPPAVRTITSLFAKNERVTTWLETAAGPVAVVLVGATNVGSILLSYANFCTNQGAPRQVLEHTPAVALDRGDPLGVFQLGSTVVLLISRSDFALAGIQEGDWIPYGSILGRLGGDAPPDGVSR
jgi:phosphatidylserine decarboxylase